MGFFHSSVTDKMQSIVLKTINEHSLIEPNESVLVGVSGGPDSVCLLHVFYSLSIIRSINVKKIFAVHVNHLLRGEESDADEKYVGDLCSKLGIDLFNMVLNVKELSEKKGISIEEAARKGRYEIFYLLAEQIGNCKIAVAHNKNDQAETILMNIMRGTGLEGLSGMEYKKGILIRPLLDVRRNEIEEYCYANNLNPRIDHTNLENIYTRNKVRLNLIPYIRDNFDVDIIESINRMSELVRDDNDYIKITSEEKYNECVIRECFTRGKMKNSENYSLEMCMEADLLKNKITDVKPTGNDMFSEADICPMVELDINKLLSCHGAIRKRIVRRAIEKIKGNVVSIENIHIKKVIELCETGRTGAYVCLPQNVRAEKSYDVLKIFLCSLHDETLDNKRNLKVADFNKKINIPGITNIEEICAYLKADIIDANEFDEKIFKNMDHRSLVQFFDYDMLKDGISIRKREAGDMIFPYNSKGTKKLKDFFIDSKIPKNIRDVLPLVAKGKDIVWVIGYRISERYKVVKDTEKIVRLEFVKDKCVNGEEMIMG